jgi:Tol biopolymer transport system component
MIGKAIGPYQIVAKLGAGGMGEVYRARDTQLNRDVAIKVLPESLSADPDRLARFQREAQVLASLNHPNIAAIYGVEGGALVMELVDGDDLAARLGAGPLPLGETLAIARQIADALEAAHERGIIHRDLKPANIKVRPDGTVKVLDFGLAKALDATSASGSADAMNSPTLTARGTQIGTILGTAAYMSPEQARGKVVDRRADIWALGVVLYEMLSGRRAFEGDDISVTLASVLKDDVQWAALPAHLPPSLQRLLARCLEKDPRRRLNSMGDARLELEDAASDQGGSAASAKGRPARALAAWLVAAGLFLALVASLAWNRFTQPAESGAQPIQFVVPTTSTARPFGSISAIAVSPDGRRLVFEAAAPTGKPNMLWLRELASAEASPIQGTEQARLPFWRPDSETIAFFGDGQIKTLNLKGGRPQTVCELPNGLRSAYSAGTWNRDGEILFAVDSILYRVPERRGSPVEVARPDPADPEQEFSFPVFLPDGRHFLYSVFSHDPKIRGAYVRSTEGGVAPRRILETRYRVAFTPGFLLFMRDGVLHAQPFDDATLSLAGDPVRVADEIDVDVWGYLAAFDVSANGVLAYRTGKGLNAPFDLVWVDRTGRARPSSAEPGPYLQVRLSRDGAHALVDRWNVKTGVGEIWALEVASGLMTPLAVDQWNNHDPIWSPNDREMAHTSSRKGQMNFFQRTVGSANESPLFESADNPKYLDDWSSDGKFLLYHNDKDIYSLSIADRKAALYSRSPGHKDEPHFSPDMHWVAYQSDESGKVEVYVASFPGFENRRKVSSAGGAEPFWSKSGRELFYLSPEGQVMSVAATGGATPFQPPQKLFQSPITMPSGDVDEYGVLGDGQQFLFVVPHDADHTQMPITVSVNWLGGLKK